MRKKRVSAAELHDLLTRDFRATAGDLCIKCRLPMPTYFAGAKEGPNWRLGEFGECSTLCHTILEDLVARYAATHELQR